MPYFEHTARLASSTWCARHKSVLTVRLMAPDRVRPGGSAPLAVAVEWSQFWNGFSATLRLKQGDPPGGDLRFGAAGGPREHRFTGTANAFEVLELHAAAPTPGALPDVILELDADGEVEAGRLAVMDPAHQAQILAADGSPPPGLATGQRATLKAEPAGTAPYRWLSLSPAALAIRGDGDQEQVEVEALQAPAVRTLAVLVGPAGSAAMVTHDFPVRYAGRVENRSVAPKYQEAATAHIDAANLTFRVFHGSAVVHTGTLDGEGRFAVDLPRFDGYELRVSDHHGLSDNP